MADDLHMYSDNHFWICIRPSGDSSLVRWEVMRHENGTVEDLGTGVADTYAEALKIVCERTGLDPSKVKHD